MPAVDETFARALGALQAGQIDDAERLFKKTLSMQPRHVPALNLYTIVLTQLRRFEEAEKYIKRAIQENATSDVSFYNYGVILKALGRYEEAIQQFDRALAIKGGVPDTLNTRGEALLELHRTDEALADFDKALALNPQFPEALVNKARALEDEDAQAGLSYAERALALQPNYPLAWLARGNLLNEIKRYDDALASFSRALELQGDLAEAWLGRGDALRETRQTEQAAAAFDKALAIKPDLASAYNSRGLLLMQTGKIDEARKAFERAIELDPHAAGIYWNYVETKKFKAGDADLAAMEALAADDARQPKRHRLFLDFALGKAYADTGDHRRAFQHLLAANAAERSLLAYDERDTLSLFDRIEAVFTRGLIEAKSGKGVPSSRPIFIVGMPRSGSTLVEQILASHPAIEGVGEVAVFPDAMGAVAGTQTRYPDFVSALDDKALASIGDKYLAGMASLMSTDRPHVTDKLLSNFINVGLIHLALPNAVILHTARNPLDSCISCFSKRFTSHNQFTYDLAELGRYYKRYQQLMQHWHSVLPAGRILDVQYEDVVADLEGQARRIVAHCALPWDERCLSFHKTERTVRTASLTQVRQPIYQSSVSRWRAYEEFLGPLLKELGIDAAAQA